MTSDLEHDELRDLLGAYALDAVDPDERERVEAHLVECHWCQMEVAEHHDVAAMLARSGAPAPTDLWDRIAATLEGSAPPPLRLVGTEPARRRPRFATVVASAAAPIALVSLSVAVRDDDAAGPAPTSLAEAASRAIADPAASRAELLADDGQLLAYAVVLPDGDGYVLPSGLPELDDGVYQLWGRRGENVVSLGVFDGDDGVVAFHGQEGLDEVMVTEEDAPVERPTTEPVVRGLLA